MTLPHALWSIGLAAALSALPAFAQQKLTLRIGAGNPVGPVEYTTAAARVFMPEVTRRAKAEANIDITWTEGWGGSIAKLPEVLEATQNGLLDVGVQLFLFEPSNLFLHNLTYYIPFNSPDPVLVTKVARRVFDEFPVFHETLEKRFRQKILGLLSVDNYNLITTFEWNKIDDLKGRKIGAGGTNLLLLKPLGVVGVQSNFGEGYNNMKTGVYEGYLANSSAQAGFKFYEAAPNLKVIDMGSAMAGGLSININTWNKLPPVLQKIMLDAGNMYESAVATGTAARYTAAIDTMQKATGVKVTTLPADERQKWATVLAGLPNEMAKEADKRKLPGTAAFRAYFKYLAEAGYKTPVEFKID
mgnify:CR=1 FL=1